MTSLQAARSPDPAQPGETMSAEERLIIRTKARRLLGVTSLGVWDAAVIIFVILGFHGIMNLQEILIGILVMIPGAVALGGLVYLVFLTKQEWNLPPLEKKVNT